MDSATWQRRFYTIFIGQAFSLVGSTLVQFSLIWWLTETTGSAATLATATIMSQIPVIALGPIAGALVDRWPRKWTLILSDGAIALLTALLGLLFWLDIAQIWHVYVILFLRALADRFQEPAMIATTSAMVPDDQLARVGGMRATLEGITLLVSPVLGALLLEVMGVQGVLPLDVLTAILAIAPLFFLPIPEVQEHLRVGAGLRGVARGMADGWRYMVGDAGLWQLEITSAMWALLLTPTMSMLPLYVKNHYGGGALELSWLQAAFGAGLIAGGLILSAWGGFKRNMTTCIVGSLGVGLATLALAFTPGHLFWLAMAIAPIAGFFNPAVSTGFQAVLQKVIDPSMQGRYWGVHSSLNRAIGPLALAVAAPFADTYGVRPLWFVSSIGVMAIGVLRRILPAVYHLEDALHVTPETVTD